MKIDTDQLHSNNNFPANCFMASWRLLMYFFILVAFIPPVMAEESQAAEYSAEYMTIETRESVFETTVNFGIKAPLEVVEMILLDQETYAEWILPALNEGSEGIKKNRIVEFTAITADPQQSENMSIYFDILYPLEVKDLHLDFMYRIVENSHEKLHIEFLLKKANIAISHAGLDIVVDKPVSHEDSIHAILKLSVDYVGLIDWFLSFETYRVNTEFLLQKCVETFSTLISRIEII